MDTHYRVDNDWLYFYFLCLFTIRKFIGTVPREKYGVLSFKVLLYCKPKTMVSELVLKLALKLRIFSLYCILGMSVVFVLLQTEPILPPGPQKPGAEQKRRSAGLGRKTAFMKLNKKKYSQGKSLI